MSSVPAVSRHSRSRSSALYCCAALLSLLQSSTLWAQTESQASRALSLAGYHARGDFGEITDTRINYLPISFEYGTAKWTLLATVSHLEVTGLGNVLVNVGGVTQAVAGNETVTQKGMGDSVVSAIYHFDPFGAVFLDFRLDVKIPTADEKKALGTGELDIGAQLDLSANVGRAAVFASLGYNKRGKSMLYPGLKNSLYSQVGIASPFTDTISAGVFYDYRQSASRFSTESHELSPYLSLQLDDSWSFTALGIFGFTDASPEIGVMGQLRYSW